MVVSGVDVMPMLSLYLEPPRFLLEVLRTFHIGDEVKVLFSLLTEAYV